MDTLAAAGADLEASDDSGLRPLHAASQRGNAGAAEALVRLGANATVPTCLEWHKKGLLGLSSLGIIHALELHHFCVLHTAHPLGCSYYGSSPLYLAVQKNQTEVIRVLVRQAGVDPFDTYREKQELPHKWAAKQAKINYAGKKAVSLLSRNFPRTTPNWP